MTSHYVDIHLRPDPETAPYQLLDALYVRLHRALIHADEVSIGVSFPAFDDRKPNLGAHMRLHGTDLSLRALMASSWLRGVQDHFRIGPIAVVPASARYRVVSRVQAKSNADRLRRRAMKRQGWDMATATERIPESAQEQLALPFVTLGSRSTGQPAFPLFLRHGPITDIATKGVFSSYGLSRDATVPWF